MVEQQLLDSVHGKVIATGVSLEEYMEHYAAHFCEWIEGVVIKMAAASLNHNDLTGYLFQLLNAYFEVKPTGRVILQPFVMRLPAFPNRRREPDLLVVLNTNPNNLMDTYMDGPADLCVEIVSEDSIERDHGDKFAEYEKGGVHEYWIIDPLRNECRFYLLNEHGRYLRQLEDAQGNYHPASLPGLILHVPTLWLQKLPGPGATSSAVRKMLNLNSE